MSKFKVGDRVKTPSGTEGVIAEPVSFQEGNTGWRVKFGEYAIPHLESDLILIPDEPAGEKAKPNRPDIRELARQLVAAAEANASTVTGIEVTRDCVTVTLKVQSSACTTEAQRAASGAK